jgi:hypothetical protein
MQRSYRPPKHRFLRPSGVRGSTNFAPDVATWQMCPSLCTCYRGSIIELGRAGESYPSLRKKVPIEYDKEVYPGGGRISTDGVGKRTTDL